MQRSLHAFGRLDTYLQRGHERVNERVSEYLNADPVCQLIPTWIVQPVNPQAVHQELPSADQLHSRRTAPPWLWALQASRPVCSPRLLSACLIPASEFQAA